MLSIIRTSLSFLSRRQKAIYFTLVISRAVSSLLDVVGIALIALLTGLAASNLEPGKSIVILGFTLPVATQETLLLLVLLILLVFTLKATVAISLGKAISVFLSNLESGKATEIASWLISAGLSNLARFDKGEIAWVTLGSPSIAFSGILTSLSTFISEGVLLVMVALTFFVVDPIAAIFVFIYFAIIVVILQLYIGQALKQAGIDASEGSIQSMVVLDDTVSAYREITIFNRQLYFVDKFRQARIKMSRSIATISFLNGMPRYVVETSLMLGVVLFVGFQFLTGQLTTGLITVGVFLTGGVRIMASLLPLQSAIASTKTQVEQARLSLQLLSEIKVGSENNRREPSSPLENQFGSHCSETALSVEFKDLSYTYPDAEHPALTDISLEIKPGQHVAFIGPSGAGKTTLVDLMLGLLKPTSGQLFLGGQISNHSSLMQQGCISYVPQKPGIVSGSIAENIALGVDAVDINEEQVINALSAAHLLDHVKKLPQGIHSSVGNQGDALSGGQIQRLGLARALYNKPRLIVLDEATSALDASSEAMISQTLKSLGPEVTVVVIAHRLSTVQHSDVVFVVKDGQITASGKFNDLRKTVPMVAEYVKLMSFDLAENQE